MAETIIYILFFLMGAFLGSFYTLAVYRIPLGEDITHKHSFCPNCKHKLGLLDLIPIFSYILLGGKCRYCKKHIPIKYLLLEILSGVVFLLFSIALNINIYNPETTKFIYLLFGALYFCSLFIIAGIDKEKHTIQKSVLIYGIIIAVTYILYLYIVEKANIYRYVIYLFLMLITIFIDTILYKKKAVDNYTIQIIALCIYLVLFTGEIDFILTVIFTLLVIALKLLLNKILTKKEKYKVKEEKEIKMPIGFLLCCTNIIIYIFTTFVLNYKM